MSKTKQSIYFSTYDDINNPHYGGGGAIAIHEVAKRLSKIFDVHVVSWDYCGTKKEIIDDVSYERFGWPFISPKFAMLIYQISLPFILSKKSFAVWCESFCPPFTTSLLPFFNKKRIVGIVHMLAAEDMERKYKLPFHVLQNFGIKKYSHLIVTSDVLKEQIQKIASKSTITIISNGVTRIFQPTESKKKYLLYLGRIEIDQKGLDLLLTAFSKFLLHNNTYNLILAGSGSNSEEALVKKLIKQKRLDKNVFLEGKVQGAKKETLLKDTSCIVIPSRFETYSLVALEAMAHGTPIVCFAIKGLSWIPDNAAKKIKPFDVDALATAMSNIVTNKHEKIEVMQHAHEYVKQFTWDAIAKKYEIYINNLLQNHEK